MITQEFSIEFDILYNNLASNAAPPLNEYEKSVFLTQAQSEIVLELYSGRNQLGLSFESNEEVRSYLKPLIRFREINLGNIYIEDTESWDDNGFRRLVIKLDTLNNYKDVLLTIKEEIKESYSFSSSNTKYFTYPVIPVSADEIESCLQNPFRWPKVGKRALRVDLAGKVEQDAFFGGYRTIYLGKYKGENTNQSSYREWYIKKPQPIILENIDDTTLTIDGVEVTQASECILSPSLHRMILDRAVQLAKQAYIGGQA